MTRLPKRFLCACLILIAVCTVAFPLHSVQAVPSSNFYKSSGDWYDEWNIDRNYYAGPNGYLPALAYETLGQNRELAYSIGESFLSNYDSKTERAAAILKYVQRWTDYGYDDETVIRDGDPQEEWAWNADEMAHSFNQDTGVIAIGDCEDMAFLCATIYKAAGFDVAVVDAPEHVALLIWLPEFSNADHYWNINDGRGAGWIWVESTGGSNPLGWTPPDFEDGRWTAYQIGDESATALAPSMPSQGQGSTFELGIIALVIIGIIGLIASQLRRRA